MLPTLPTDKETFSIGEVCRLTGLKPHRLRYWESAVGAVRPARRGSGHRRFSRADLRAIARIRELVEDRGLTLAGAKKQLRAEARRGPTQVPLEFNESSAAVEVLRGVRQEISGLLKDMGARSDGASRGH